MAEEIEIPAPGRRAADLAKALAAAAPGRLAGEAIAVEPNIDGFKARYDGPWRHLAIDVVALSGRATIEFDETSNHPAEAFRTDFPTWAGLLAAVLWIVGSIAEFPVLRGIYRAWKPLALLAAAAAGAAVFVLARIAATPFARLFGPPLARRRERRAGPEERDVERTAALRERVVALVREIVEATPAAG